MEKPERILGDVAIILAAAFPLLFLGKRFRIPEVIAYLVTGVLIGPRAVLTAAHCTRIPGHLAVFVGADVTAAAIISRRLATEQSIQSLTSIVEPLMMILVGLMVGVIVIAMYLPMFKMLSLVK